MHALGTAIVQNYNIAIAFLQAIKHVLNNLVGRNPSPVRRNDIRTNNRIPQIADSAECLCFFARQRPRTAHIGRAEQPHRVSGFALDQAFDGIQFYAQPAGRNSLQVRMQKGMRADGMAFIHHSMQHIRKGKCRRTQNKKCCRRISFFQSIQYRRRGVRAGSIVKSKGDLHAIPGAIALHHVGPGQGANVLRCYETA